jgi:hypothetical protein
MGAHHRAVDDRSYVVVVVLQRAEDGLPVAFLRPVRKPVVDRLPRAKPLRQVTPRKTGSDAVEHRFDEESVTAYRGRARLLDGQHSLQTPPLGVRERVSVHPDL